MKVTSEKVTKLSEEEKQKRRDYYKANKQKFIDKAIQWKKDNPEKAKESAKKTRKKESSLLRTKDQILFKKYGISLAEYEHLYTAQNQACKICKTPFQLHGHDGTHHLTANVDHCHFSGQVRGLLCTSCNRGLGFFKDNATLLRLAAEYLDASNF